MKVPSYSCPDINHTKRWLKIADDNLGHALKMIDALRPLIGPSNEALVDEAAQSIEEAKRRIDIDRELERLRELNTMLREWGSHWRRKYEELEQSID